MNLDRDDSTLMSKIRITVEVDRAYGSDASNYTVQVLRYATDGGGNPTGNATVLVATATGTSRRYSVIDTFPAIAKYVYSSRVVHTLGTTGPEGVPWVEAHTPPVAPPAPFAGRIAWMTDVHSLNSTPVEGNNGVVTDNLNANQLDFVAGITGGVLPPGNIVWSATWESTDPTWVAPLLNYGIDEVGPGQSYSSDNMACAFQPWSQFKRDTVQEMPPCTINIKAFYVVNGVYTQIPGHLVWYKAYGQYGTVAYDEHNFERGGTNTPTITVTSYSYTGPYQRPPPYGDTLSSNNAEMELQITNTDSDPLVIDVLATTLDGRPFDGYSMADWWAESSAGSAGVLTAEFYSNGNRIDTENDTPADDTDSRLKPYGDYLIENGQQQFIRLHMGPGASINIKRASTLLQTDPALQGAHITTMNVRHPLYLEKNYDYFSNDFTRLSPLEWTFLTDIKPFNNPSSKTRAAEWSVMSGGDSAGQFPTPEYLFTRDTNNNNGYWRSAWRNPPSDGQEGWNVNSLEVKVPIFVTFHDATVIKWQSKLFTGNVVLTIKLNPTFDDTGCDVELFVKGVSRGLMPKYNVSASYTSSVIAVVPEDEIKLVFTNHSYTNGMFQPQFIVTQQGLGGTPGDT